MIPGSAGKRVEVPGGSRGPATHDHSHGVVDPVVFTSARGIWAVKRSFVGMMATAALQLAIVLFTGSVALLADTIHNFGDAATAVPLWAAFRVSRLPPNERFTYGYGRAEDFAGVCVILAILASAILAAYVSVDRLLHPHGVEYLYAVMAASVIGFLGNEAVAVFRIRVGKEIGSAALVADGYHARVDGLTSLAVLVGATGVALGYPLADPLVGLLISVAILRILWVSARPVVARLMDAVDPEVVAEVRHILQETPDVREVTEVRVRWLGHRLQAEANLAVSGELPVARAHEIAKEAQHRLLHHLKYLSYATIHVDPSGASGERYHGVGEHSHGDLPPHSH